jgi:DNA-binding winged helix-turn-helix (wHTH) protein
MGDVQLASVWERFWQDEEVVHAKFVLFRQVLRLGHESERVSAVYRRGGKID